MPKHFTSIAIIYNPVSTTGRSKQLAHSLQSQLVQVVPKEQVSIIATEYAGHAEELAEKLALQTPRPLIISASGDGGYNEVINGIMKAVEHGASPATGLLPAGNANDHHRNLHEVEIIDAVATGTSRVIDLLRLRGQSGGKPVTRYAHSYIGLGLTPQIGKELNKTQLNPFKEIFIVTKVLLFRKPVHLKIHQQPHAYDSILASNVPTMSKYFSVYPGAEVDDGKFELTIYRRRNKLKIIRYIIAASTKGLPGAIQTTQFSFQTMHKTVVQLDGELLTLDANTTATIHIEPHALRCIV